MLEWFVNYQMLTCGIAHQMLLSVVTYHIFTYNIMYQLLGSNK